jgi:hypothetical protein
VILKNFGAALDNNIKNGGEYQIMGLSNDGKGKVLKRVM